MERTDSQGWSSWHGLAKAGSEEVQLRLMREHSGKMDRADEMGWTGWHLLADTKHTRVIKELLTEQNRFRLRFSDMQGKTVMDKLRDNGNYRR